MTQWTHRRSCLGEGSLGKLSRLTFVTFITRNSFYSSVFSYCCPVLTQGPYPCFGLLLILCQRHRLNSNHFYSDFQPTDNLNLSGLCTFASFTGLSLLQTNVGPCLHHIGVHKYYYIDVEPRVL